MKNFHVITRSAALIAAALFVTGCAGALPEEPTEPPTAAPTSVPVPVATGDKDESSSIGKITVTPPAKGDATETAPSTKSTAGGSETASSDSKVTETASSDSKAAGTAGRFVMGDVGLDVPLKTQPWSEVLSPGDHESMWALVDEEKGWVWDSDQIKLVTTHACSLRECPGNKLLTDDNKPAVAPGEILYLDGDAYEIQDATTIKKEEVINGDFYSNKPGKLLIVTCRPNSDGKVSTATHNVVITAQKVTS